MQSRDWKRGKKVELIKCLRRNVNKPEESGEDYPNSVQESTRFIILNRVASCGYPEILLTRTEFQ